MQTRLFIGAKNIIYKKAQNAFRGITRPKCKVDLQFFDNQSGITNNTVEQVVTNEANQITNFAGVFFKEKFNSLKVFIKKNITKIKNNISNKTKNIETDAFDLTIKQEINEATKCKILFDGISGENALEDETKIFSNLKKYLGIEDVAPSLIYLTRDARPNVRGAHNNIYNTISFSKAYEQISLSEKINLLAHELKHCEQTVSMLRCEGIGLEKYSRATAENYVRNLAEEYSSDIGIEYNKALKDGKGEEFIEAAIEKKVKDIIPIIEKSYSKVFGLPKIKVDSPEGIRAFELLEAQRNYKLFNIPAGYDTYRNNLLEREAYEFGEETSKLFKNYIKQKTNPN